MRRLIPTYGSGVARQLLLATALAAVLGQSACFKPEDGGSTGLSGLPGEVSNVSASGTSTSEITVTWTAATGPILGYRVAYAPGATAPSDCTAAQITEATQTATTFALQGIPDDTQYSFRVCAANDNPVPDVSPGATATSSSLELPPPDPTGLTTTVDSSTAITLSWSSAGGSTADFRASYQLGSTAPASCTAGSTISASAITGTSYQVTGLTAGRLYSFRVCAINANSTPDESSGATASNTSWADDNWKRRRLLTFDNSAQTQNLSSFPVLVVLDSSRIDYSQTQNAGEDLRFTDADSATFLDYEIERWNESGTSYVWVRVPQIDSASSTDSIWMYYGNPAAVNAQNSGNTWSANYRGVWHLAQDPGSDPAILDSTSNTNDSNPPSGSSVSAQIGSGILFNGVAQNIAIPADATLNFSGDATIEGWFQVTSNFDGTSLTTFAMFEKYFDNAYDVLVGLAGDDYLRDEVPIGALFLKLENNNERLFTWTNTTSWIAGAWHHFVVRIDGSVNENTRIFIDAVDDTDPGFFTETNNASNLNYSANLGIGGGFIDTGNFAAGLQRFFGGTMDEVRLSQSARSDDWINAQYLSMTDASFVGYGSEQSVP